MFSFVPPLCQKRPTLVSKETYTNTNALCQSYFPLYLLCRPFLSLLLSHVGEDDVYTHLFLFYFYFYFILIQAVSLAVAEPRGPR
jgi:hypothetical protein